MSHPKRDVAITTVMKVLRTIGEGIADVELSEDEYEYRINVIPRARHHCQFWLGFSTYGTYGLCFGHGLRFEDLSLEEFPPAMVVEAILNGRVRETIWSRGGQVLKSKGDIALQDGRTLSDTGILTLTGSLRLGDPTEIAYVSYFVQE